MSIYLHSIHGHCLLYTGLYSLNNLALGAIGMSCMDTYLHTGCIVHEEGQTLLYFGVWQLRVVVDLQRQGHRGTSTNLVMLTTMHSIFGILISGPNVSDLTPGTTGHMMDKRDI